MSIPLSATDTTGSVADNQLSWYFGHGSANQLDVDGTHTWPPNNGEDTVHYTVLVEAGIGTCTDSETVTISVAPTPFVQTLGGEVCSGTSFSFGGNAFNLGEGADWFWEVDNVWSGAAQDYGTITSDFEGFSYTFENPDQLTDTVTIDLEVNRLNGCQATASATLLVRPAFAPEVNDAEGCAPFAFTVPIQQAISIDWDFDDAADPGPEGASSHLYTAPGNYLVSGQGTSVFGCLGSATAEVQVFGAPTPALAAENTLCAPDPVNPQRSDTPEDGATSWTLQVDLGTTYPWNGSPDTLLALAPGTHLLTLLASNDEGCSAETSVTVLVQEEVSAGFSLPEGGCEPIAFAVNGVSVSNGAIATWTIDTPFGTDTQTGNSPAAPQWTALPGDPGSNGTPVTYGVELSVVDPLTGCSATAFDSITVEPQPQGQLVIEGLSGCDVQATFSYTGTADSLIWDFGDPFFARVRSDQHECGVSRLSQPLGNGVRHRCLRDCHLTGVQRL